MEIFEEKKQDKKQPNIDISGKKDINRDSGNSEETEYEEELIAALGISKKEFHKNMKWAKRATKILEKIIEKQGDYFTVKK